MKKIFFLMACFILLSYCSASSTKDNLTERSEYNFFTEYRAWTKINKDTIIRESENEAREIYGNITALQSASSGIFATGSILVKEHYYLSRLGSGSYAKGDLFQISVMRKTGIGEYGGWDFMAYEPITVKEIPDMADGCVLCHSKRKSFDYTFSNF